ncbi:hypothetical protein [Metalysinibacillus jejuensis]|uniref:hypothetical protein n=1 Tax=Metalysinibacillus jejuensis TaxID=914327 RepID=UPI0012903F82|nr:hypothetical protein [Metalysinibacillus jejuensis]
MFKVLTAAAISSAVASSVSATASALSIASCKAAFLSASTSLSAALASSIALARSSLVLFSAYIEYLQKFNVILTKNKEIMYFSTITIACVFVKN